jgi:hypothetical protein
MAQDPTLKPPTDNSPPTSESEKPKGYAQPVGSRLRDRLEPLLKQGYNVTKVRLPMPDGSVKEF